MTIFPHDEQLNRFASFHSRDPPDDPNANVKVIEILPWWKDFFESNSAFQQGGSTLFGTVDEYVKVMMVLANQGVCPNTGARLLEAETVEYIFI